MLFERVSEISSTLAEKFYAAAWMEAPGCQGPTSLSRGPGAPPRYQREATLDAKPIK